MIGAIIGDIVGSRFEFSNHLSTDFKLFDDDCSFTDDTVCTIAVADALVKRIPFEEAFIKWYMRFPNIPYGSSFLTWLKSPEQAPYCSFGNGSAMRVSPCAWFSDDRKAVLDMAQKSAQCSHNHQEGLRGAMCIADCIYHARFKATKTQIHNLVTNTYGYDLRMSCDDIRKTNRFNATCQVTVPQAIIALLESTDFENAIRLAISIGGDSDTIAAMTGSIAEAMYGLPYDIAKTAVSYLLSDIIDVMLDFSTKYDY